MGVTLLHKVIEQQVDRSPDACAVSHLGADLTYAELDAWANRLAHRLRRHGVGPETSVAVIAERNVETVVALLAVLKAGGAYVPIDPANPPRRFHYLMSDCGASVLVAPESLGGAVPRGAWTTVPSDLDQLQDEPATRPASPVRPDNPAYVIYTSGSTGEPKGVTVTHRQITHATLAQWDLDRPEPACFLLLVSFSFDASAVGLYWTLTRGGQIVVPSAEEHRDPRALRDLIARHRVTHLDCTPSLYSLIHAGDATPLASLHCVIVGGEACPRSLVERHHDLLPECLLVNNYGPTETTVWTTTATLRPEGPDAVVPIGFPIAGSGPRLLDEDLRPVEDGEVGELYVGGAGVARGYRGRPGLTGEWFLPDPWAEEPGGRMYRTGDRVRRLPDGQLEFRGRVDHQVKVRGYRVELAEVEHALATHPAVVEAAADVRTLGESAGLVAWVAGETTAEEVRSHAAALLPAHMVPGRIVVLDTLPRNVAGKIDRAQLADPRPEPGTGREMTALETEVAQLVTEITGVSRLGVTQSYFELGANSLHLARLALGLWSRFGVGVSIHHLFEVPHVAGTAQMIEAARRSEAPGDEPGDLGAVLAETTLEESIRPAPGLPEADWNVPRHVLLTGATGYLGAFLLKELIERTDATVWCLVRAPSSTEGKNRVREVMRGYLIWDDRYDERVEAVAGDLAEPLLGLGGEGFRHLAGMIDSIYHCGALVNFVYPYSALKPANVDSVADVLRLAVTERLKVVHYISSIDVFLHTGRDRPYLEDEPLVPLEAPEAYARSKWAGDHLVRLARERGIPAAIYRPGMMMSHGQTGATQTSDYLLLQIKGLLEFGVVPDMDYLFDAIPIDYAARAITHISLGDDAAGRNFHLWNLDPVPLTEVYAWVRSFGYEFETVPLETAVQHLVTLGPDNPLFPLLPLLFQERVRSVLPAFTPEVLGRTDLRAECANTLAALDGSGIACPPMTPDLAHKCFSYMIDVGFMPGPAEQRARLAGTRSTR
ncbi:MAG: amino acid adenylation domain-containing protein [Nonomuraea sp.]|nr:amino acid adenylation domain-containing protein [Nonomuraea sp.]